MTDVERKELAVIVPGEDLSGATIPEDHARTVADDQAEAYVLAELGMVVPIDFVDSTRSDEVVVTPSDIPHPSSMWRFRYLVG